MRDFDFRFELLKSQFFDRDVMGAMSKAARTVLSRFGAFVRTTARQSIEPAPKEQVTLMGPDGSSHTFTRTKSSRPGHPPYAQQPNSPIRRIYFAYDPREESVVVGPIAYGARGGEAPDALEHGGTTTIVTKIRGKRRRIRKRIEARPTMGPAFDENLPHLRRWRNTVT